jgi:hypothetical protein
MDRRQFLVGALMAAAAAATVRFAITSASAAPAPEDDGDMGGGLGDMVHRTAEGWESHMLPFAKPFPSLGSLQSALMESRAMGLFR